MRCGADMADTLSASTSSVTMRHTASRSLVAEWHIVTCHVFEVLWVWSVGKADYRPAKAFGLGSLSHRAGIAIASSVVILGCQSFLGVSPASPLSPVQRSVWKVMRSRRAAMT